MLVTSDNPVATYFPAGRPRGFTGLAPSDAELHFPVSATLLLVAELPGHDGSDMVAALTDEHAQAANAAQALGCDQMLLCHPETPWPGDLVLGGAGPAMPTPAVTLAPSTGPSTFPARYPDPFHPRVVELLDYLGAVEVVE